MFEPMNFVENLSYMGKGMLGILIVMGAIILVTVVLNKIFSNKKKKLSENLFTKLNFLIISLKYSVLYLMVTIV